MRTVRRLVRITGEFTHTGCLGEIFCDVLSAADHFSIPYVSLIDTIIIAACAKMSSSIYRYIYQSGGGYSLAW